MGHSAKEDRGTAASKGADWIAEDIANEIAARRLPPGTRLREEALSRLYAVSRTKIRAALLSLSKDKLIDIIPDKGAFVSQPDEREAREVFAARRVIEAAVVREFIEKAKGADFRRLERHLNEERSALSGKNPKARSQMLGDFHVLIAEVAGNQVVTEILTELVARSTLITMLYQTQRDAVCSSDDHVTFLAAAKEGRVDEAVRLMLEHLTHVEEALDFDAGHGSEKDLVSALLRRPPPGS